jgi:hypothetical protein
MARQAVERRDENALQVLRGSIISAHHGIYRRGAVNP